MAFERLSACVEELRAGGSTADQQLQQRKLLRELFSLDRRWSPELLTPPSNSGGGNGASATTGTTTSRKLSGGNGQLFLLLLQALTVYSGSHTSNSSAGASGASTMSLGSSAPPTSESVLSLLCDLLVRAFDYSAVSIVNETLTAKNTSIYVKTALVFVVSKLPLSDAVPFVAEIVAFVNKTIKTADYYMKQLLLESAARVLDNDLSRFAALHAEALRIVSKTFQDKVPEVRLAAAGLLHVLAQHTTPGPSHASSSGSGSGGSGSSANNGGSSGLSGSGSGNSSGASASGSGSSSSIPGVTQEAIMYIATKGMDDVSPDARRAYSAVVGLVLAKFVTSTPDSSELASDGSLPPSSSVSSTSAGGHDDDAGRHLGDHESANGSGKSKLAFKMPSVHLTGMAHLNLPGSLSRRKAAAVHFSTVASIIGYLRETVANRYLTSNPNQSHGGILASYSLALASMFEHLPADTVAEQQFNEIVDATLSILDHPFALGDLTRARNAVCYVLRFGLFPCLTERQQEALLGAYVTKLNDEAAAADDGHHHKLLAILVEVSHMLQAMGEACVSHAQDAASTLQTLLAHEKQSVRFQASVALASLVTALPYKLKSVLMSCIRGLRETAAQLLQTPDAAPPPPASTPDDANSDARSLAQLYIVQGRSAAIAHMLRAVTLRSDGGLAHSVLGDILALAEQLIESQFVAGCADSVWLTCTRAGWTLVGSLVAVNDAHWVHASAQRLLDLWLKASELHTRESSLELLRIEGAVIALHGFLSYCHDEVTRGSDSAQMLAAYILNVFLAATQERLSNPLKRRGQVARHRVITWLLKAFVLLPPIFSDSYIVLLDLIAEYTVAQSLTSLRQSALVPAPSTFLHNALASADDVLEVVTTSRLVAGDSPSALYSRELNHVLALLQLENALSDTELEVQYSDNFWGAVCDLRGVHDVYARGLCSSFTYVRLVDASVFLFGRIFHFVPEELQLRCLQHYASALADAPRGSCDVNVVSLLFAAIREAKCGHVEPPSPTAVWPQQMQTMLCEMLGSEHARVRRSAGEALGMLASLISEANCKALVTEIEKRFVADKAPVTAAAALSASLSPFVGSTDPSVLCAGAAFALACIKRVCGSRVSIDTGLLFRFAGEIAQPLRTWILHAWSIVVESVNATGGDYEQYIKSTASLLDAHVLAGFGYSKTNKRGLRWHASSKVAIGRILNAVVAVLGPDLASSSKRVREFYTIWALLRQDGDLRVELEYLKFLEQVVVFAPARFQRTDLACILGVVSDAFTLAPTAGVGVGAASGPHSGIQLSPPSSAVTTATRGSFATLGEQHRQNALLRVNGTARSVLQQAGLSCIRTLVERDPSHIERQSLQCLLFHALHVECSGLTWRYLPRVHGLWDGLTFKRAVLGTTPRSGADEIRATIRALVDIDGANAHSHELIVWSLLCRSIAVGESGASHSASNPEQLMMSPKGMDLPGLSATHRGSASAANDDSADWGFAKTAAGVTESDKRVVLASDAIAAQLDVWRQTKRVVSDRVSALPPLTRHVRQFAIECVLRVLELVATNAQLDTALHFDLAAARAHFLERLSLTAAASAGYAPSNFVCMYLDEYVTLACHAATASTDGSELQMFQSVGLRLLHVLVHRFAAARDPEVPTGDAFVLDPYQAQIMSAIRQALKQAQPSSSSADADVYAPLLIEAFGICGGAVTTRLVQDKVALGRVLKMIVVDDFGHAHFIGDELTRATLALANLACVAQMLMSSIALAVAAIDDDDNTRGRQRSSSVATSPLVKVFVTTFAATAPYLVQCWQDVTLSYGVVMHASAQWPRINTDCAFLPGGGATSSRVLGTLLPVPTAEAQPSTSSTDKFRELYKRYWPHVASVLVATRTHLPSAFPSAMDTDTHAPSTSQLLLAFAVFHIQSNVRDRHDSADDLLPLVQTLPLLLSNLEQETKRILAAATSKASGSDFVALYQSGVSALVHTALRSVGDVRIEALKALRACLTRDTITYCASQLAAPTHDDDAARRFGALLAQAALCPAEALWHMCEPSKSGAGVVTCSSAQLLEVVRCATTGVVLLHTTESVRHYAVHAVGLVAQCYRNVAGRAELHDAVVTLTRAAIESTVAFAKSSSGEPSDAAAVGATIRDEIRSSARVLLRTLHDALVVARERSVVTGLDFALRLLATYAVAHAPTLVADDLAALHEASARAAAAVLDVHVRDGEQRNARFAAHLLRGLHAVAAKFVDASDAATARWYLAALAPLLVDFIELYAHSSMSGAVTGAVQELEQVAALLQLLASQMDDARGAVLVRALLPKVAVVLQTHAASEQSVAVAAALDKLLLSFAQTRATAFKEVVVALDPALRSVLELALRSALTGGAAVAAASSGAPSGSAPGKPLDLSRYG